MDTNKDMKTDILQDISSATEDVNPVQSGAAGENCGAKAQDAGNGVPLEQSSADLAGCVENNVAGEQEIRNYSTNMPEVTLCNVENIVVDADSIKAQNTVEPQENKEDCAYIQPEQKQVQVTDEVYASGDEQTSVAVPEKSVSEYAFAERNCLAFDTVAFIAENFERGSDYVAGYRRLVNKFPVLKELNLQYFEDICRSIPKFVGEQRNNVYVAFVLFYIYTSGKYPQQYWSDAVVPAAQTEYALVRALSKQLSAAIASESNVQDKLESVMKEYLRTIKRKFVSVLMRNDDGLGMANIYEMLWDVFVNKYCNYNVMLWKRTIDSYLGKTHTVRHGTYNSVDYNCEYSEDREKVQIYAVSYTGCQEKPMHVECEDYCFTEFYDEDTWLAVSCDGVGSCSYSSIGSRAAAGALSAVIGAYLTKNSILDKEDKGDEKRGRLGKLFLCKDKKAVHDDEMWGKFMYYLQNNLAADVYEFWQDTVNEAQRDLNINADDLSQYTTTLQFAFGCKAFVACGRVGDGRFFVGKREGAGNASMGGFMLNDGISGVTRPAVYTIEHLKNNPHALQVSFFSPDELDDIIISSDGCDGYLGDGVLALLARADEFSALPFKDRCEKLAAVTRLCAEVNSAMYGSGDDSTIVHIHFKH